MSSPTKNQLCEICKSRTATYRPKQNRTLCLQHFKELEVERSIHLYTAKNIENLAGEMFRQNQVVLSKKKILEIMKKATHKSFAELGSD